MRTCYFFPEISTISLLFDAHPCFVKQYIDTGLVCTRVKNGKQVSKWNFIFLQSAYSSLDSVVGNDKKYYRNPKARRE